MRMIPTNSHFKKTLGGTSNDLFFIDGTKLVSNHVFDETSETSQLIRITAIDSAGLTKTKEFFVEITTAEKPDDFFVNVDKETPEGGLVAGAGYYKNEESVTLRTTSNSGFSFSDTSAMSRECLSASNPLKFKADGEKNILTSFTQGYHMAAVDVTLDRHGYAQAVAWSSTVTRSQSRKKELMKSTVAYFHTGASTECLRRWMSPTRWSPNYQWTTHLHWAPLRLRTARFDETGAFVNFFAGGLPLPW